MKRVELTYQAEVDLDATAMWYQEQAEDLGEEFLREFANRIDKITEFPKMFPTKIGNMRQANLKRFPYGVFYVNETDKIVVIRVVGLRRDPKELHT